MDDNNIYNSIVYPNDSYSDLQNCSIPIIQKVSGALSLAGSLCIIFSIFKGFSSQSSASTSKCCFGFRIINIIPSLKKNKEESQPNQHNRRQSRSSRNTNSPKNNKVQKRLLLGLSFCDVIQSSCHVMSSWPIPSDTIYTHVRFNIGNQMSCSIAGFLLLFGGLSVPFYNAFLCIYYLICVKYPNITERKIATQIEPIFHFSAIMIPLSLCIVGAIGEMFNPVTSMCFVATYPRKCDHYPQECFRGDNGGSFRKQVSFILPMCFLIIVFSLSSLYCEVKKQERRMTRYSFTMTQVPEIPEIIDNENSSSEDENDFESKEQVPARKKRQSIQGYILSLNDKRKRRKEKQKRNNNIILSSSMTNNRGAKRVFRQSLFYVIPFLIVWTPPIVQVMVAYKEKDVRFAYFMDILVSIFAPLQGFFNALIYFDKQIAKKIAFFKRCTSRSEEKEEVNGNVIDDNTR